MCEVTKPFRLRSREIAASDALNRLLATADPLGGAALEAPAISRAFDLLGQRIVAHAQRSSGRRTRRVGRFALAFAAAAILAGASAGAMYSTHTGFFPATAGTENDTSEYLRTDAPDFPPLVPPLVAKLVKDIPFPPGESARSQVPRYVAQVQPGPDGIPNTVQAAGIKGTFSFWAVCAWRGYWLHVHRAGDSARQALAADRLSQVASSEAMKKVDSAWPLYLAVARREADGDPSAPRNFADFYRVNCAGQPQPWSGK